jgi:hypothetical protein
MESEEDLEIGLHLGCNEAFKQIQKFHSIEKQNKRKLKKTEKEEIKINKKQKKKQVQEEIRKQEIERKLMYQEDELSQSKERKFIQKKCNFEEFDEIELQQWFENYSIISYCNSNYKTFCKDGNLYTFEVTETYNNTLDRMESSIDCLECSICKLKSPNEKSFHLHKCKWNCFICDKTMMYGSKKQHENIHKNERIFKCSICKESFNQPGHLKTHMVHRHSDKPKLECPICFKKFAVGWNLRTHIKTHEQNKIFHCTYPNCHKEFYQKINLDLHVKNIHLNERSICQICNKQFNSKYQVFHHMHLVHPTSRNIQEVVDFYNQNKRWPRSEKSIAKTEKLLGRLFDLLKKEFLKDQLSTFLQHGVESLVSFQDDLFLNYLELTKETLD